MSKGFAAAALALALAVLPESAAAQQIGASLRIVEPTVQPTLLQGSEDLSARIPAGWAYSTIRGQGSGAGSTAPASLVRGRTRVLEASSGEGVESRSGSETVTLTFVPL